MLLQGFFKAQETNHAKNVCLEHLQNGALLFADYIIF